MSKNLIHAKYNPFYAKPGKFRKIAYDFFQGERFGDGPLDDGVQGAACYSEGNMMTSRAGTLGAKMD